MLYSLPPLPPRLTTEQWTLLFYCTRVSLFPILMLNTPSKCQFRNPFHIQTEHYVTYTPHNYPWWMTARRQLSFLIEKILNSHFCQAFHFYQWMIHTKTILFSLLPHSLFLLLSVMAVWLYSGLFLFTRSIEAFVLFHFSSRYRFLTGL